MTFGTTRFGFLEGKASLVVLGTLRFEPDVDPKVLAHAFSQVYNFGEIHCTGPQRDALMYRFTGGDGEIVEPSSGSDEPSGNYGYLKL